jgi:hypothetical protein
VRKKPSRNQERGFPPGTKEAVAAPFSREPMTFKVGVVDVDADSDE